MAETLGWIIAACVLPIVTQLLKRYDWASGLGQPINVAVSVLAFVGVWAFATRADAAVLQDWIQWAINAATAGSAGVAIAQRASK